MIFIKYFGMIRKSTSMLDNSLVHTMTIDTYQYHVLRTCVILWWFWILVMIIFHITMSLNYTSSIVTNVQKNIQI